MGTLDVIAEYLAARHLRHRRHGDDRIDIGFTGDHTAYEAVIGARGALVWVIAPHLAIVPPNRVDEALQLANRLNATRIPLGTFSVHPTDRRLMFEIIVLAPGGPTDEQMQLALAALTAIDRHFPAFVQVLWSGAATDTAADESRDGPAPHQANQAHTASQGIAPPPAKSPPTRRSKDGRG